MNYDKTDFYIDSADDANKLACYDFRPKRPAAAVVQIVHGMNESAERYAHFADFLADRGIATVAHDQLGHGKTVKNEEDYGFFGSENGYMNLLADVLAVTRKARELYPGLPLAMFAHSMGSFIGRLYITEYAGEDCLPGAVILSGTSGPLRTASLGILEARRTVERHGERYRSKIINRSITRNYNSRYPKSLTVFDWLTRDEEVIAKYIEERGSRFIFTAAGFRDLFTLLKLVSAGQWYKAVPKELPMLLIAGSMDPVGQFGLGVTRVYNSLKKAGVKDVRLRIYPDCRHELINELNKEEVFEDIYGYLAETLKLNTT